MRQRPFPCALLLCVSSALLAQNTPDFSGVYLQNPTKSPLRPGKNLTDQDIQALDEIEKAFEGLPLILVVTQKPDAVETTRIQNGIRVTSSYSLKGSNSKKAGTGSGGRAKFKKQTLLIEYTERRPNVMFPLLETTGKVTEKWELSPDSSVLTIRRSVPPFSWTVIDAYTRQASLDSALKRATEASLTNRCVCLRYPHPANTLSNVADVAELGFTVYRQLNTCVVFDAQLSGEFFRGLDRVAVPGGSQFRKAGAVLSEFPHQIDLGVIAKYLGCARDSFWVLPMMTTALTLPLELLGLRFRVKWTGSATRDLGELESELLTEPWSELRQPERLFRMQIPSKGVPLTDSLEIRILTKAGDQIACISGHI